MDMKKLRIIPVIVSMMLLYGCGSMFTPNSGSVTHKKSVIEKPDGTKTTTEETVILQPEGSKTQTSYTFTQEPFSLSGIFGSQYNWENVIQKFKAMKPFIWVGILVVIGGVVCTVKRWCNTKVGVSVVLMGIGFSLFGTLMPIYGVYVFWGLVITGIGVVTYMLWKYVIVRT